jgi:glycosyltransferase involved in cell wall biosynthesis
MDHLPKVLFVNDFAPDSLAVADLSRQLLLGYPAERLSWWYWRTSKVRGLKDVRAGSVHRCWLPNKLVPNVSARALRGAIMEWLCAPMAAWHLRRTVARVKPDVVWALLYSWPILVAHRAVPLKGPRLHVSLWDYPDTIPSMRTLGPARCRRFLHAIYGLVRKADSFDGISAAVLEDLAEHAGRSDGVLVHSGFEPPHLQALENSPAAADDGVIRLAYVGTVISEKAFLELLAALDKIRTKLTKPIMLEFYGVRGYKNSPWFNPSWMMEHGLFSDSGLVESLQRCSWGIVVMDPEGEDLRYSRFSFPNKIGTYLSAGVPVLGVGHPHSSLIRMMQRHSLGVFTTAASRDGMVEFLSQSLHVEQPRSAFRKEILQCARTEFDAQQTRSRFWAKWGKAKVGG